VIALYSARGSEMDLSILAIQLGARGFQVVYPIVTGPGQMGFYRVVDGWRRQRSETPARNPLEPVTAEQLDGYEEVRPQDIAVIVTPGIAFDAQCYRLGFGGGFYDRYLQRAPRSVRAYGVGFSVQMTEGVPVKPHDRRLDAVVVP
jgi:5-formyltetrahydrofolate cyclo-ligase